MGLPSARRRYYDEGRLISEILAQNENYSYLFFLLQVAYSIMVETAPNVHFKKIDHDGAMIRLAYLQWGDGEPLLYLHGWGQSRQAFLPLIETLGEGYRHIAVDCPGFGQSSMPPSPWGTEEYAACILKLVNALGWDRFTVIGHSFGGRVAIRMAIQAPERISSLILISAAGLRRRVSWLRRTRIRLNLTMARLANRILPSPWGERIKRSLYNRIASRDYLQAGDLRATFVKVVQEDLAPILSVVKAPALLLWGAEDSETPPELGRRMQAGLPNAEYIEFDGFDHNSILNRGRHQIGHQIGQFLARIEQGRPNG